MTVVGKILDVAHAESPLRSVDPLRLTGMLARGNERSIVQHFAQVAHQRNVHLTFLFTSAGSISMWTLRVDRVGLQVARHAIVEAHAKREQQVGFLNRY